MEGPAPPDLVSQPIAAGAGTRRGSNMSASSETLSPPLPTLAHDGRMDAADAAVSGGTGVTPGACPFTVDRPIMRQRWEWLTFLHWSFDPPVVQRLLPAGLQVETFGGAAWVGLVPFFMRVATGGGSRAPWISDFCETNVRTYVRDAEGRSGIWFFSLDAARLALHVGRIHLNGGQGLAQLIMQLMRKPARGRFLAFEHVPGHARQVG